MHCPTPVPVYTLEQYLAISAAIAEGAMKVKYGDKEVEYRSLNDMLRIQSLMYRFLFPCANNNNGRKFVSFSKGTDPRRRYRF